MSSILRKRYRIFQESVADTPLQQSLDKVTRSMVADGNFIYIDPNQQNGFRLMNECESSDDDDEVDKLGKYLVNINDPHSLSCKTKRFIHAMKSSQRTQDRLHSLLERTLQPAASRQPPAYLRPSLLTLSQPPTERRYPTPIAKRRHYRNRPNNLEMYEQPKAQKEIVMTESAQITKTNMKGIRMHLPALQRKRSRY